MKKIRKGKSQLLSRANNLVDKGVSIGKEAANDAANKVIEQTTKKKTQIDPENSNLTNNIEATSISQEESMTILEQKDNSHIDEEEDNKQVQEESKSELEHMTILEHKDNSHIDENEDSKQVQEGEFGQQNYGDNSSNSTEENQSVPAESKPAEESMGILELKDNSYHDNEQDNEQEKREHKSDNEDYEDNSTNSTKADTSIPEEIKQIKKTGEDSEDFRENSEKELKALISDARKGMKVGLKDEHKIGGAEKGLIKTGNTFAMKAVMRANKQAEKAKAKAGSGGSGNASAVNEVPQGFTNFIETVHTGISFTGISANGVQGIIDFGFKVIAKSIIKKAVGEVPERYKFMVKVATTFAVKQALSAIMGGPTGVTMNLTNMKLDALKKQLTELSKKVDIIIEEPMQTAGDHFFRAINHIEDGDYEDSIPEIREALNNSIKAINYIKGDKKYMKGIVTCTKYLALGDQLLIKYDKENKVFLPYDILPIEKKKKLSKITRHHLDNLIKTNQKHKGKASIFSRKSTKQQMEVKYHDIVDVLCRQQFPFLFPPGSMIHPKYLPAGITDAVIYNVHKKVTWSPKHLSALLPMWKNEKETHFRVLDGCKLLEFPFTEDDEFDISMPSAETLLFTASDGTEMIPTILKIEEEYPDIIGEWEANGRDDCIENYNASHEINRQDPVLKKNWVLWEAAKNGDVDKITYLINVGAEIDAREPVAFVLDKENKSALHHTVEAGYIECSRKLLELGANPDIEDEISCTPLHYAARLGNMEMVELLYESGANIMAEISLTSDIKLMARDMTSDSEIKEYLTQRMNDEDE